MAHSVQQTGPLPLLSQCPQPAWTQVVEAIPDRDHLDLTAQLQEIAHGAIACTSYSARSGSMHSTITFV